MAKEKFRTYDPETAATLLQTIEANVNNERLSDKEFRKFIERSLPVAEKKKTGSSYAST